MLSWLTADPARSISLLLSIIALLVSAINAKTARAALRISKAQESRRLNPLQVKIIDGWYSNLGDDRLYEFLVATHNPSEAANAISSAELLVDYRVAGGKVRARFPLIKLRPPGAALIESDSTLAVPCRLEPGNTVSGRLAFLLPRKVVMSWAIDTYHVSIEDTHGKSLVATTTFVHEAPAKRNDDGPSEAKD